jgi:hypothetical protein
MSTSDGTEEHAEKTRKDFHTKHVGRNGIENTGLAVIDGIHGFRVSVEKDTWQIRDFFYNLNGFYNGVPIRWSVGGPV